MNFRTTPAALLLCTLAACGSTLDSAAEGAPLSPSSPPAAPSPPSATPSVPAAPPKTDVPPPVQGACDNRGPVIFNPASSMLARLDVKSGTTTDAAIVQCAGEAPEALAVGRDGAIFAMTRAGQLSRMTLTPPSCTPAGTLPAAEGGYTGLAITSAGGVDTLVTLRAGSSAEYLADGVYHHKLLSVEPATGATTVIATADVAAAPTTIHGWSGGLVALMFYSWDRAILVDPTSAATVTPPTLLPGLGKWIASVTTGNQEIFGVGDIHCGTGLLLPSYRVQLPSPTISDGPALQLPTKSHFGLVTGSTVCSYAP